MRHGPACTRCRRCGLQARGRELVTLDPRHAAVLGEGQVHALAAVDPLVVETAAVADPVVVDVGVLARHHAGDLALQRVHADAAALGAQAALARQLVEVPDPRGVQEVAVLEGAHGADFHGVERERVVDRLAREYVDHGVVAAVDEAEFTGPADFIGHADAARALDAAGAPDGDLVAEQFDVRGVLLEVELAGGVAVVEGVVLQAALAGLVALGAVERVVDQLEVHDAGAHLLDVRRLGEDLQAVLHDVGAGGGHHLHGHELVAALDHLARLDEAHAAVAADGQARVVAEVGDVMFAPFVLVGVAAVGALAQLQAGHQQVGALRRLVLLAVDGDVDQRCVSHGGLFTERAPNREVPLRGVFKSKLPPGTGSRVP